MRGRWADAHAASNWPAIPILAGYTASKLPWTRKHRPEDSTRRLARSCLPHDYLNFWLTGEYWMEYGDASGTGWLDVRTRRWSKQLLRAATDPDATWPPVPAAAGRGRTQLIATVAATCADELRHCRGHARVAAGGGDNMMAAIGTGNVEPGRS